MREAGNLTTSPIRSSLLSPSQNCSKRLVLGGACDYLLGPPRPKTLKPGGPFGAAVLANARKSCPPVCNVGTLIVRVGFFFGGGSKHWNYITAIRSPQTLLESLRPLHYGVRRVVLMCSWRVYGLLMLLHVMCVLVDQTMPMQTTASQHTAVRSILCFQLRCCMKSACIRNYTHIRLLTCIHTYIHTSHRIEQHSIT